MFHIRKITANGFPVGAVAAAALLQADAAGAGAETVLHSFQNNGTDGWEA